MTSPSQEALAMARRFHEAYERLAPSFGYETRPETREFDPDSPNGRLMIAVCREVIPLIRADERERAAGIVFEEVGNFTVCSRIMNRIRSDSIRGDTVK